MTKWLTSLLNNKLSKFVYKLVTTLHGNYAHMHIEVKKGENLKTKWYIIHIFAMHLYTKCIVSKLLKYFKPYLLKEKYPEHLLVIRKLHEHLLVIR